MGFKNLNMALLMWHNCFIVLLIRMMIKICVSRQQNLCVGYGVKGGLLDQKLRNTGWHPPEQFMSDMAWLDIGDGRCDITYYGN